MQLLVRLQGLGQDPESEKKQSRTRVPRNLPRTRQLCPNTSCDRRYCSSPPPAHLCGSPSQRSTICACRLRHAEAPSPLDPLPYASDISRQLRSEERRVGKE